jgi:hypothetical protein
VQDEVCSLEDEFTVLEVSSGNGPVDALARALNRALLPSFASLSDIELTDYKVRLEPFATGAISHWSHLLLRLSAAGGTVAGLRCACAGDRCGSWTRTTRRLRTCGS